MVSDKKLANAIGGKTARACDSCIRKRARWYCPADDAFLCQACDSSVHSANSLARRHKRVRLKTESMTNFKSPDESPLQSLLPTWYRMSTRKPRTPRHGKQSFFGKPKSDELMQNPLPLVPEIGTDEASPEEDEEQLLYRVPIFDQFAAELCRSANSNDEEDRVVVAIHDSETADGVANELKAELYDCGHGVNSLHGFDTDLADFAADVESLLGKGLEDESFDMKGLGLMDSKEDHDSVMEDRFGEGKVKVEEEGGGGGEDTEAVMAHHTDTEMDMTREAFELSFDFDSPATCDEEDEKEKKVVEREEMKCGVSEENINKKKKILLRLDYEGVIAAWDNQGCPWTTGDRPVLDPNDCWPDCMGGCGWVDHNTFGEMGVMSGHSSGMVDGGREARVSRYREKRRTRLFSKKIRYEVRKLNAEKRPRMKGRFVKRANLAAPSSCFPLLSK